MKKIIKTKIFLYSVIIEPCEEGGFFAHCPTLQGCHVEGETYAEVIENIEDAIKIHLELRKKMGDIISTVSLEEGEKINVNLPVLIRG